MGDEDEMREALLGSEGSLLGVVRSFDPALLKPVGEDDGEEGVGGAEDEDEGLFLMGAFLLAGRISKRWISLWGWNSVASIYQIP